MFEIAFVIQGNSADELPEQVRQSVAVRCCHQHSPCATLMLLPSWYMLLRCTRFDAVAALVRSLLQLLACGRIYRSDFAKARPFNSFLPDQACKTTSAANDKA